MSDHFSREELRDKQRNELVEIANRIGIEGLFGCTTTEIADKIYDKVDGEEDVDLGGYDDDMKSKLMSLSRSDLVEVGREAGIDKMISMSMEEIADEICSVGYQVKSKSNIEEKLKEKISEREVERAQRRDADADSSTGVRSNLVTHYARKIKNKDRRPEVYDEVREFQSEISDLDSGEYDEKMKSLFYSLSPNSESEVWARESIVGTCSTVRVNKGGEMADWVYDLYKELGYPVERSRALSSSDLGFNLSMGEKYLAEEIPYQRT